ncbi:glycosyltransferase [Pseudohoeflea coraliihabitans]|uniref:Glycosyltransferase n=1 Tax=Pseudohoeflea coraliihabitans TaxID=2860393 RepID=A0ABS6WMX1_9HYPH|nr:glycosyltransferase [Pseudohoeflea sp. DP4N28-3]MBW3097299.1 glycosyltransferase [Pseudohoeflea sp. DP4N28-3]
MTRLSICIPTRNRQAFAIDAVRHMLQSPREDFEVIVADNSDDAAPLADFAQANTDSRFRLIAPAAQPLSTGGNWSRLIPASRGEWITVIADDDYLDPELSEVIRLAESVVPKVDAISWGRTPYTWPDARSEREISTIPTTSHLRTYKTQDMMKRLFFWDKATDRPACPFGIYHGALKRDLIERIRDAFSGTYFEQGNVDYDNICKTVMLAEGFVYWERPLSVMGTCHASNAMGMRESKIGQERAAAGGNEPAEDFKAADFPFPTDLGLAASIGHTIERFKQRYGIELTGWEDNFIQACARDVETSTDRAEFSLRKKTYSKAIAAWRGSKAAKTFQPHYKWQPGMARFIGAADDMLYFDMDMGNTRSAGEFYRMVDAMLFPVELLESRLN